jgi:hypothetical protein
VLTVISVSMITTVILRLYDIFFGNYFGLTLPSRLLKFLLDFPIISISLGLFYVTSKIFERTIRVNFITQVLLGLGCSVVNFHIILSSFFSELFIISFGLFLSIAIACLLPKASK